MGELRYNNEPLAAYSAAAFLSLVRGLPRQEIEVETSNGIYKANLRGKDGLCEILMPKCKLLYSNNRKIIQNIDINHIDALMKNGLIRAVRCKNCKGVSEEVLQALACSSDGENIVGTMAISASPEGYSIRAYPLGKYGEFDFLYAAASLVYGSLSPAYTRFAFENSKNAHFARLSDFGAVYLASEISTL